MNLQVLPLIFLQLRMARWLAQVAQSTRKILGLVVARIWDKCKKIQGILLSLHLQHGRHQVNWFGVANFP